MEAAIDTLKWYQHSKKAVQANRNMETTNDLVTFDPVEQVSVRLTSSLTLSLGVWAVSS
jgi:hypothetical protein